MLKRDSLSELLLADDLGSILANCKGLLRNDVAMKNLDPARLKLMGDSIEIKNLSSAAWGDHMLN